MERVGHLDVAKYLIGWPKCIDIQRNVLIVKMLLLKNVDCNLRLQRLFKNHSTCKVFGTN